MAGNVLFIQTEAKKMVAGLKAVGVSQIPLPERARDLIAVTAAVTNACDVDIGFRARRSIRAGDTGSAGDAQGGINVACRGRVFMARNLLGRRACVQAGPNVAQPEFVAMTCGKLRGASDGPCMRIKLTGGHRKELVRLSIARCIPEANEQRQLGSERMVYADARGIHMGRKQSVINKALCQSSRIAARTDNLFRHSQVCVGGMRLTPLQLRAIRVLCNRNSRTD